MIDIYKYISKLTKKSKFYFIFIMIICLFILKNINIKLNHILAIIIGFTHIFFIIIVLNRILKSKIIKKDTKTLKDYIKIDYDSINYQIIDMLGRKCKI